MSDTQIIIELAKENERLHRALLDIDVFLSEPTDSIITDTSNNTLVSILKKIANLKRQIHDKNTTSDKG